ncbi:Ferritin-like [Chitinophaga sp. CF118]|uniref:ferritin-like domain-containing protein n=1 Tax=Chitinophaga sp. CF118 TaxID=1884367 RepID=UPI0008DF9C7A|nr:ferritin-like domain-containing protein [Chitinophaga sp. CF118]SFD15363.1 Ferritin-like [Chitinophaga sp. CF118]
MKTKADPKDLFDRPLSLFEVDKAAVEAIVQQAVNVELFTIPLYMTSLYSIQGVHQITGKNSDLYQGRLWPGLAPTFRPGTGSSLNNIPENEKAFNTIFSVFIEEMLHLQLASNVATALGIVPQFTQLSPASGNYAWTCYSPDSTVIPGIIDFKDCKPESNGVKYAGMKVKLDELNLSQNDLFLAIEAPEEEAKARVKNPEKYFPIAPFGNWEKGDPLPMFGSIGHMYQCLWDYLDITYKDDEGSVTTLWEKMYSPASIQQDIFNTVSSSHPYKEFQKLETTISGWLPEKAKELVFKLICGITDQGEGSGIRKNIRPSIGLQAVDPVNQASDEALKADYPSYTDAGTPAPSSHAYARFDNGAQDHYERFEEIRDDLKSGKIITWPTWHSQIRKDANKWTAKDLMGVDYDKNKHPLPSAEDIAGALNRLNNPLLKDSQNLDTAKRDANYKQFCEVATGAIAGITTVLDQYWQDTSVGFPYPSMGGSGDRLMMCWAVFGQLPDLSVGVQPRVANTLYHACQGMNLNQDAPVDNNCASAEVYHNCKGSNSCKAEGGCGFVQLVGESKSCSQSVRLVQGVGADGVQAGCGLPAPPYSAPADNMCKSFGGCAVPISASQIYPPFTDQQGKPATVGAMELNDFEGPKHSTTKLPGRVIFEYGDLVYDVAWDAYTKVLQSRNPDAPEPVKPQPSDIRLAFPPST